MHTTTVRSPQSLAILDDRTPWRSRPRSILSSRWHKKSEEPEHDSLYRLDNRLLTDIGLYRERRIHHPKNRTDQQPALPVPVALLAMWAPI